MTKTPPTIPETVRGVFAVPLPQDRGTNQVLDETWPLTR